MSNRTHSVGLALLLVGSTTIASLSPTIQDRSAVLAQTTSTANQAAEADRRLEVGKQQFRRAEFKAAIATYQQILVDPTAVVAAKITALAGLGDIYLWINQTAKAEEALQQALKLARETGDRGQEADVLALLSIVDRNRQDYAKALDGLEQALKLSQATGSRTGETRVRFLTGTVIYSQGQYTKALAAFQTALGMAQADRDQDEMMYIYDWMASAYRELKDVKQAEAMIQQQQKLSREGENRTAEYAGLGIVASLKQQQPEQVLQAYQTQLAIAQAVDNPWFQRSALVAIGGFYTKQKQLSQAVEAYQKALGVAKTLDAAAVAEMQNQIGGAYYQAEQYANAVAAYQQALKLYQAQSDREKVAQTLLNLGVAYDNQEQYSQARETFQQAKTIAQQIPNRVTELSAMFRYGGTYLGEGNSLSRATAYNKAIAAYDKAVDPYQQAQRLAMTIKDTDSEQSAIRHILILYTGKGLAFDKLRQYAEAVSAFQQGLAVWRQYRDRLPEEEFLKEEMSSLETLGYSYINNGEYKKALASGQQALHIAEKLGDFKKQVSLLKMIAGAYNYLGEYPQALIASQKALTLVREKLKQHPENEMSALIAMGQVLKRLGKYQVALGHYEQALTIAKNLKNIQSEITILNNVGSIYSEQGEYLQALEALQKSRTITQDALQKLQSKDMKAMEELCDVSQQACLQIFETGVISIFNNLGLVYQKLGRYSDALDAYQESLNVAQKHKDLDTQTVLFNNIGSIYLDRGDYSIARDRFQASLKLALAANASPHQFSALINLGIVYDEQGKPSEALERVQQALALAQTMQSPAMEATAYNNLGNIYQAKGDYKQASQFYQKSLAIHRQHGLSLTTILNNIANLYLHQGRYAQAIDQLKQAIDIAEKTGDASAKVTLIGNLGSAYQHQSLYAEALKFYQQAQALSQKMGSRSSELTDLLAQGRLYRDLGQYSQASAHFKQALLLSRELGEKGTESTALTYIGNLHFKQEQYTPALQHYQQALKLAQETGDLAGENRILQLMAQIDEKQGNPKKAVELFQQVLKVQRQVGVRPDEALTLSALGRAYTTLGNVAAAQEALRQALVITQDINDPATEAKALSHLGALLAKQNQPELAIVFYKQSVSRTEAIRHNIRSLSRDDQATYTQTIATTYRQLANLLLQQHRVMEAMQILDLLKVQELQDYFKDPKRSDRNAQRIPFLPQEEQILKAFNPQQPLEQTLQTPTVRTSVEQLQQTAAQQNLTLPAYQDLQARVRKMGKNIALFYPLILDDRLELVLFTPDRPPIHHAVPVKRSEFEATIKEFLKDLMNPRPNQASQRSTQQLYQWLIQPLEADLKQTQTIVYAPDGQMRYIPLAALHDGKQWLIQRFQINYLTALALTPLEPEATTPPHILAGAFHEGEYPIPKYPIPFKGLPSAKEEVEQIAAQFPNTTQLLDKAFTRQAILSQIDRYSILHLATHAKFLPGTPENSFIVMGDGGQINLREIASLKWPQISLVVLSACETGVGDQLGNGLEILGFGYRFQQTGARATIASLWVVDDHYTQALMAAFYQELRRGVPKAQALRQAQIFLLDNGVDKPMDWAPFILIGNGL